MDAALDSLFAALNQHTTETEWRIAAGEVTDPLIIQLTRLSRTALDDRRR